MTKIAGFAVVTVLVIAYAGVATYIVLGDTSLHGLTLRFYNVSWACTPSGSGQAELTFNFQDLVLYSSTSLTVSLSHVTFSMVSNGLSIQTVSAKDSSFGPGQSATYGLSFSNQVLDPHSQPSSQFVAVAVSAQGNAGLSSSQIVASYSETVHFGPPPC